MYLQSEEKRNRIATMGRAISAPARLATAAVEPEKKGRLRRGSLLFRSTMAPVLGARYLLLTSAYYAKYLFLRAACRRENVSRLRGKVCMQCLFRLGPLYIKVGQVMATQTNLFPKAFTDELSSVFDNTPTSSPRYIQRIIESSFGRPWHETFKHFDYEPLASGSIAQVHKAELPDGRKVAVKIIKKGVKNELEPALLLISTLISTLEFTLWPLRRFSPRAYFDEIASLLEEQTDLLLESRNQAVVAGNFEGHPYVTVPKTIPGHVSSDVLVMEYIEGIPSYRWQEVELPRQVLAERLQTVFNTMPYFHGAFHLDPHPGNVSFTRAGGVILYDFGLVGYLSERDRWALSGFYYACIRKEWSDASERFLKQFAIADRDILQERDCVEAFKAILRVHFEERKTDWSTLAFINQASRLLRKHDAKLSTTLSGLASALLTGEGFLTMIDPGIDLWENARVFTDQTSPFISDDVKQRFDRHFREKTPKAMARRDEAKRYLIAPTHLDRYCFPSEYPLIAARGQGCRVFDIDDNEYIDLSCGYGPNILGYAHPVFVRALAGAARRGSINAMASEAELELAQTIVNAFPGADKLIFGNSGTEVFVMAVRLCRGLTGKSRVAKFEGHYHGFSDQGLVSAYFRQDGSLDAPRAIEGTIGCDQATVQGTVVLQYGHPASLDIIRRHQAELACVIIEPLMAALVRCDVDFLRQLRSLCTELAIPLIFDEVVTGFRVEYGGIQTRYDVHPDLTCLGKIIGGGTPVGALIGRAGFMDIACTSRDPFKDIDQRAFVGGTMSGNSVCAAAGLAGLRYLDANRWIYSELEIKTKRLADGLKDICNSFGVAFHVRAMHSIFSMSFGHQSKTYFRDHRNGTNFKANISLSYYMRKHGIYVPEMHTMLLNMAHGDRDIDLILGAFRKAVGEMVDDRILLTNG